MRRASTAARAGLLARAALLPVVVTLAGAVALSGCSADSDAVDQSGQYQLVSPDGKTVLTYASNQRQPPLDLSGESLANPGSQIHLSDFPGKVVVLNIWGSWCAPCRAEAPELQQVYNETKASDVQFLGVDVKDPERSDALDFLHDNQIGYPSIYDFSGRSLLALHNVPRSVVPTTIVLDREHRVAAVYLGQLLAGELLPEVRKLAAE